MSAPGPTAPLAALTELWRAAALPAEVLDHVTLTGADPVLASSFAVGTAAQVSLGAAALAAACVGGRRTGRTQRVAVDMVHAALDSLAHFTVDNAEPQRWDKLSGLYACGADAEPGWVRIHANFAHHRDGALKLIGLPPGPDTERAVVTEALKRWRALDFEEAAAAAGLVVAAVRSFDEWDRHPQAAALRQQPVVEIRRIGEAAPVAWPDLPSGAQPLHGLKVLDLTRILAGPVAGRTLAAYGADVMLINSPKLPNIEAIADTSRGKLSAHLDLQQAPDRATLRSLIGEAHVFLQGYRPGALEALGFGPRQLAALRPGIVCVSLSAYGSSGPWGGRRGFDSLVQTATGFNRAEADAASSDKPQAMPLQILDYAAGYLLAFGAQAALLRQASEGGSWQVQVSLAGVGHWLRGLGRVAGGFAVEAPSFEPYLETVDSGFGRLTVVRHAARFADTPAGSTRPLDAAGVAPTPMAVSEGR